MFNGAKIQIKVDKQNIKVNKYYPYEK